MNLTKKPLQKTVLLEFLSVISGFIPFGSDTPKLASALMRVKMGNGLERNQQKSKIRALVEHVFGFMENSMNGILMRCIGIKRARCHIGLVNLACNIFRYAQLMRLNRVKGVL
jgi:hypothetical protein